MISEDCKNCKHVLWLLALGLGVRCKHPDRYAGSGLPSNTIKDFTDCEKFKDKS